LTAPYVKRLVAQIEASTDVVARAMLTAELACYWARVGEFEEAERLRVALRGTFGDGREVRVSILIMCIEGLLLHFKELSPGALDRLSRARLLSVASGHRSLIALTSAWVAHIHFNGNRFQEMVEAVDVCLGALDKSNLAAVCRVSVLLGDAQTYAGDTTAAQFWYDQARKVASEIGDQAFVGALTYNRSALRVFGARLEASVAPPSDDLIRLLAGEVRSAINYQAVARLLSLDHLLATSRIGVLMLQRDFSMAKKEIESLLLSDDVNPETSQAIILKADLALCLARLNLIDESIRLVNEVTSLDLAQFDPGDRVLVYTSLRDSCKANGEPERMSSIDQLMSVALAEHKSQTSAIASLLARYKSPSLLS
jgi:hypothetical protein